ncbi:hypothetical protein BH10PSE6_BH10PSE6_51590 [soil metagenome]
MNNPLHFYHTGSAPTASDTEGRAGSRAAGTAAHPTPESVGFEIGVILAVTLGVAYAVPLILSVFGIE